MLNRNKSVERLEKEIFIKNLIKIGYQNSYYKDNFKNLTKLVKAFQRRFRQDLINGVIDKECLKISKNLIK